MTKFKSYEVIVKTSGEWYGTIQAKSLRDAKRLAEDEFNEGNLTQCGEEVEAVVAFRPRTRVGSWRTFERRFDPQPAPAHDFLWEIGEVAEDAEHADYRYWWTVLDCEGRMYVTPGFRFVNRFAFIRCAHPWTDEDLHQPGYRYD
jgi:hypothetical protein